MPSRSRATANKTTNFLPQGDTELTNALAAAKSAVIAGSQIIWNQVDTWQDRYSGRIVAKVPTTNKLTLTIQNTGEWDLECKIELYVNAHFWVYKLDLLNSAGVRLFTLVTPRIAARPPKGVYGGAAKVAVSGVSKHVREHFANINSGFRRGAGEYRD